MGKIGRLEKRDQENLAARNKGLFDDSKGYYRFFKQNSGLTGSHHFLQNYSLLKVSLGGLCIFLIYISP